MLELFNQYQSEIIAALALIVVVILYFIIKSKQKKSKVVDDPYDTPQEEVFHEEEPIATHEELDKTDEFISHEQTTYQEVSQENYEEKVDYQQPVEEDTTKTTVEAADTTSHETPKSKAHKREVPPHGKINKENFKEFANKRLLLAEDNLINQKVILGLLAESGIEVVVADDGQIALEILQEDKNFMLVLMDAHMPRIDGFEATRQIRANPELDYLPVIALSGDTAADDIRKMEEAGMEAHLEKPLKMDALYDILYTYSENDTTQTSSDEETLTQAVVETEDDNSVLNTQEGLSICGGDQNFYNTILREFINDYKDSSQKLQTFINEKRFDEADKLLLDIVGVSANIGAKELHKSANKLKGSLTNFAELKENFLAYHQSLKNLLLEIQKYFQNK